jgi:hypothetical protein
VLFEEIEIAIGVKERKATVDAKSGDPTIHSFPNCKALGAKLAIIPGALNRILAAGHGVDLKIREMAPEGAEIPIVFGALQNFAEDQIAESRIAAADQRLQQVSLIGFRIPEEIYPDRGINDHRHDGGLFSTPQDFLAIESCREVKVLPAVSSIV